MFLRVLVPKRFTEVILDKALLYIIQIVIRKFIKKYDYILDTATSRRQVTTLTSKECNENLDVPRMRH